MINVDPHPELRPKYFGIAYVVTAFVGLAVTVTLVVAMIFRN